ncbi:MAG: amidase domain-containing protein [Clostridia bacterium]|nr:amidase domain-containing protein [Clostridia bacterium]
MYINAGYRAPVVVPYDRVKAVQYAHRWALGRNPRYYNFDGFGGDCTNFASQVIYAGSGVMNYKPVYGWYYINANKRSPSWTGVNFLYNFLVANTGVGPFAERVDVKDVKPGDIVQLSFQGGNRYDHSPVIVVTGAVPSVDNILIAAHTYDRDMYPLTEYSWKEIRFIHIKGVRK